MGRGAEFQSVEQEAELDPRLFLADAHQFEHLALHGLVVNTDAAAADFRAVEDQVVSFGPGLAGIGGEQGDVFIHRRGEGVMNGDVAAVLLVPFEQREVGDPDELVVVLFGQTKALPQVAAQAAEGFVGNLEGVGYEQQQVAELGIQPAVEGGQFVGGKKFGDGGLPALLGHLHPGQPLGAVNLDEFAEVVEILA